MSHLATIGTNIRSEELLRRSLCALGIPVHPTLKQVEDYMNGGGRNTPVDVAVGTPQATIARLGFARNDDGTYRLIGDMYRLGADDHTYARALGGEAARYTGGSTLAGTPLKLLQEYALQVGEAATRARGMSYVRVPLENKDKLLRITGGSLPPGGCIMLTARADGTSTVAAFNVKGPSCKAATKWLEDVLGTVTDDHMTAEFFHETTRSGGVVHVG